MRQDYPTNVEKTVFDINDLCKAIHNEKGGQKEKVVSLTSSILMCERHLFLNFIAARTETKPYHLMCAVLHNMEDMIFALLSYDPTLHLKQDKRGVTTVEFAQHLIEKLPPESLHYQGALSLFKIQKEIQAQIIQEQSEAAKNSTTNLNVAYA